MRVHCRLQPIVTPGQGLRSNRSYFIKIDTAGEVMFMRASTPIHQIFKHLSNVNSAYLGFCQQYQNRGRALFR